MSFLKNNSVAAILIAVAFLAIGYGLGKTSSSHSGCHKSHVECCSHDGHGDHAKCGKKAKYNKDSKCSKSCSKKCEGKSHEGCKGHGHDHGDHSKCSHEHHSEELIIVETLKADGFEGDTTITIPGGEIKLSINGEDVDVEVEIDEEHYDGDVHEIHKEVVIVKTTSEEPSEDE